VVWQAAAKLPPVVEYPHGGFDGPPRGEDGPTDGGDPDEFFAYTVPTDPQVGIAAVPEAPRHDSWKPWMARERASRWLVRIFAFRFFD
jgi:hypothetical protein